MAKKTSHSTQQKKRYHHGDLRNSLIKAGLELLAEEGSAGLELRKVARRVGVSQAAPYRHFADKQALLAAIAEEGFQQLAIQMEVAVQSATDDPRAQLLHIAHTYVQFALTNPAHMREMFSGSIVDRTAYPSLYAASKVGFGLTLSIIERGQELGIFRATDSTQMGLVAWSLFHGLAMLLIENQILEAREDTAIIEPLIETSLQTFFMGLVER